jgi:hypothetical protein
MKFEFCRQFLEKISKYQIFMKIRQMGTEWLHSDRRTNMELSRFANSNAPNMATNRTDLPSKLSAYTSPVCVTSPRRVSYSPRLAIQIPESVARPYSGSRDRRGMSVLTLCIHTMSRYEPSRSCSGHTGKETKTLGRFTLYVTFPFRRGTSPFSEIFSCVIKRNVHTDRNVSVTSQFRSVAERHRSVKFSRV